MSNFRPFWHKDYEGYIVGFTGSRNGMTDNQKHAVASILYDLTQSKDSKSFSGLHGDCIGADDVFNTLCRELNMNRFCRPCTFESMRARSDATAIAEPIQPMERNRLIVSDADEMIACPPNKINIKSGSGTWATIRYAKKKMKGLTIVFPDGELEYWSLGHQVPQSDSMLRSEQKARWKLNKSETIKKDEEDTI